MIDLKVQLDDKQRMYNFKQVHDNIATQRN